MRIFRKDGQIDNATKSDTDCRSRVSRVGGPTLKGTAPHKRNGRGTTESCVQVRRNPERGDIRSRAAGPWLRASRRDSPSPRRG